MRQVEIRHTIAAIEGEQDPPPVAELRATLTLYERGIEIGFDGYGCHDDDTAGLIWIELQNGHPVVYIWEDIEEHNSTKIVLDRACIPKAGDHLRARQMEHLRELDYHTEEARKALKLHKPGEVVWSGSYDLNREVVVIANGYGQFTVEDRESSLGSMEYLLRQKQTFDNEEDACTLATEWADMNEDDDDESDDADADEDD